MKPSTRHTLLAFTAFVLAVALLFSRGCGDPEVGYKIRIARKQASVFGEVATILARDCGREKLNSTNMLPASLRDPGWPGWKGPYLDKILNDPWGTPYKVDISGVIVSISSAGPDRKFGTADDIAVEVALP